MERKKVNLGLFVLILICFILPFTTVSCSGEKVAKFNGLKLAFGSTVQGQKVKPSIIAIFLLLLVIAGITLYFWNDTREIFATAIIGVLGTIFMFILKGSIGSNVKKMGEGLLAYNLNLGYYMVLLLFIIITAFQVYIIYGSSSIQSFTGNSKK